MNNMEPEKKDVWEELKFRLNNVLEFNSTGAFSKEYFADWIKTHFIPRAEVVEKIRGMRKTPLEGMLATDIQIGHGYNAALDDLLDLLTQEK